jgi:hypothetical protein
MSIEDFDVSDFSSVTQVLPVDRRIRFDPEHGTYQALPGARRIDGMILDAYERQAATTREGERIAAAGLAEDMRSLIRRTSEDAARLLADEFERRVDRGDDSTPDPQAVHATILGASERAISATREGAALSAAGLGDDARALAHQTSANASSPIVFEIEDFLALGQDQ